MYLAVYYFPVPPPLWTMDGTAGTVTEETVRRYIRLAVSTDGPLVVLPGGDTLLQGKVVELPACVEPSEGVRLGLADTPLKKS